MQNAFLYLLLFSLEFSWAARSQHPDPDILMRTSLSHYHYLAAVEQ